MKFDKILLSHGSGGKLSHQLIEELFLPLLGNQYLNKLDDSAVLSMDAGELVMTTDSYIVDPIFFPGGDIGKLAISGTVNDLSVMGAIPQFLSLGLILEEGFPVEHLKKILQSVSETSRRAGVKVVTGDTKVVPHGSMDKIFINTSGIGRRHPAFSPENRIRVGDQLIINGTIGDHGTTIMAHREGLEMQGRLKSDCAPLNDLIHCLFPFGEQIRIMRDPTRGGVATTINEFANLAGLGILIEEDKLPIQPAVDGLCEILGLDPLYLANEGKVIVVADPDISDPLLKEIRKHPLGTHSEVIGEVVAEFPGKAVLHTRFGSKRILDMLTGEPLPRIC